MHSRILIITLFFLLLVFLGCLPEKNPLVVIKKFNFPETLLDFPVSNLEGKIFAGLVGAHPISDSIFADCWRFDNIANNKLTWASPIYNFKSSWSGNAELISHLNYVGTYFPLNSTAKNITHNYFIIYISIKDEYFNNTSAWGPVAGFVFPQSDYRKLGNTLKDAVYGQLVVLGEYFSAEGAATSRLKINFGSSGYAFKPAGANVTDNELKDMAAKLLERNGGFIETGFFTARWMDFFEIKAFDDKLEGSTLKCGETDDNNLKIYQKNK